MTAYRPGEHVLLTPIQFEALREYSTTLPTGTTPGKQWKREIYVGPHAGEWWLGEYGSPNTSGMTPIYWKVIDVMETHWHHAVWKTFTPFMVAACVSNVVMENLDYDNFAHGITRVRGDVSCPECLRMMGP